MTEFSECRNSGVYDGELETPRSMLIATMIRVYRPVALFAVLRCKPVRRDEDEYGSRISCLGETVNFHDRILGHDKNPQREAQDGRPLVE